jgi:hypothetical protein
MAILIDKQVRPMPAEPVVPVLILSGTVGVGKTAILESIHELLIQAREPHACLDADALSLSWPVRGDFNQIAMLENVASVWANARAAGATRLVLAAVIERQEDRDAFRSAVPGADVTVCQLEASKDTRMSRLRQREHGTSLEWHLQRTEKLRDILERAAIHDFVVDNDRRARDEVAREVLLRADWSISNL